jgi:hypothetical protein
MVNDNNIMLKKKDKYQTVLSIYSILFACNLLINVDHGTIPAATVKLKTDLGIDNVALGLLGSLVFFGLTLGNLSPYNQLGSLLATPIFTYWKAKHILMASFAVNAFALVLFILPLGIFMIQAISRFMVGFC